LIPLSERGGPEGWGVSLPFLKNLLLLLKNYFNTFIIFITINSGVWNVEGDMDNDFYNGVRNLD
jgi:hypothetical protein